jgi:hypothetical protein
VADITTGEYHHAEAPAAQTWIYDDLARRFILRGEKIEVTAPLAGVGILLLMVGAVTSLLTRGRMP